MPSLKYNDFFLKISNSKWKEKTLNTGGVNFKAEENNKGNNNYYSYPWLSGKNSAYYHF